MVGGGEGRSRHATETVVIDNYGSCPVPARSPGDGDSESVRRDSGDNGRQSGERVRSRPGRWNVGDQGDIELLDGATVTMSVGGYMRGN